MAEFKMRKKPGPKPRPPSERMTTTYEFRVSMDMLMLAHEAAVRQGISSSEWMRRAIVEKLERERAAREA